MQRGRTYYPKSLARGTITTFALVATVALALFGCDGSQQQGSGEDENPPGSTTTSISAPPPPRAQQAPPPRTTQEGQETSPERYKGLEVGESAKFENGLIVTVEGASLLQAPVELRERLGPDDRLVAMRFSVGNVNLEGQTPSRTFNVTTALWQARDQSDDTLETLYPLETSLVVGKLPNPSPDYPYLGWQGELRPGQERQGSMLFAAPLSTKMRVAFTHPVMGSPPFGEWELGTVLELPQAP